MFLRQSTSQDIRFGPFLDIGDGVTEETTLTLANTDIRLSKDGAAFAAKNSGGATHDTDGWYSATLDATDTVTVGELVINIHQPANTLPVWRTYWVIEEAVYDAHYGAAAAGPLQGTTPGNTLDVAATGEAGVDYNNILGTLDAAEIGADAITAAKIANGAIDAATFAAGAIDAAAIANGAIDAATFAANAIDAAALAADAVTEIGNGVWDTDATLRQTLGSFGQAIGDPVANAKTLYQALVEDAVGASVTADVATVQADTDDIQTRLPAALIGGAMDSDVSAIQAAAITAAAIATDAIDADALAADAVTEIRSVKSGTATSGSTTTLADTVNLTEADTDYWKGCWILITSGSSSGQVRYITGFTPASDLLTFAPALTQAITTNTFEILPAGGVNLEQWLAETPVALLSQRVRVQVGAMAADVLDAAAIANGAIDAATFAAGAIDAAAIAAGAIDAATFAAGAIDATAIAANAIGASQLATDAIGDAQIATGAIETTAFAAGAINAAAIGADAITAAKIQAGAIDAATFAAGAIDAAAIATDAIGSAELATTAIEEIARAINPQFNTAFSNITFEMYDSTNHNPSTGLSPSGERSLDGGAYTAVSGSITEISDGTYQFDALAADMNGALIVFRFFAASNDDTFVHVKTAS